jgi:hypothetical protein
VAATIRPMIGRTIACLNRRTRIQHYFSEARVGVAQDSKPITLDGPDKRTIRESFKGLQPLVLVVTFSRARQRPIQIGEA